MQTKTIMCPLCKTVLEVKNSKNEEVKQINCPSCQTVLQVRFAPQKSPVDAPTFNPNKPTTDNGATQYGVDNGATQYGVNNGGTQLGDMPSKIGTTANLLFCDKSYLLEEGQNIIGRKGMTSKATVQIDTDDRYMSRQHCSIIVQTLPNGIKRAVLNNYQNKNNTIVDGQQIENGDEIRLTDGNRITMGHTTVTFKLL